MPTLHYKGWRIGYYPAGPETGKWRADRHGVGMCANNKELLYRMIDLKTSDDDKFTFSKSYNSL